MEKKRMFKILAKAKRDNVIYLSGKVLKCHEAVTVKAPSKTLIMLRMKDPVSGSPFYPGELLACEAVVEVDGVRGMALTMGDDFDKVYAMAVIDSAFNGSFAETTVLEETLETLERDQISREENEISMHAKSRVNFKIMEDR